MILHLLLVSPDCYSNRGKNPLQNGDTSPQNSDKRQTWWEENGPHIWKGMICALTYKESDEKGTQQITQNEEVKKALLDTNNKPQNSQYQYQTAKLDENSVTDGPKSTSPNSQPPTLKDFVLRPTYFRYLEEWGETFCRERAKRLAQIKHECMDGDTQKYSGDGEACNEMLPKNDGTVHSLEGPSCAISCSSYRKWIDIKKTQYEKQKGIYKEQKEKCKEENDSAQKNNDDNGFCGTVTTSTTAGDFLENLGPCSKNENGVGKTDFDKETETFQHAKDCKPCSKFKVECNGNGKCSGGGTKVKCNGKDSIDAKEIAKMRTSTQEVTMLVSDDNKKGFEDGDLQEACGSANIFKGIRKDQWKCGTVCGVDICEQTNVNKKQNDKEYIQIRALMRHKWIKEKEKEWKNIKKRFNEQYKNKEQDDYNVKTILEELLSQIAVVNDQDNVIKLSTFDNSCGCSANTSSTNSNEKDAIDCMLNKLGEKANKCKDDHKPSDETHPNCDENLTPLVEDEDDTLHEEIEVKAPNICPQEEKKEQQDEEEKCDEKEEEKEKKEKEEDDANKNSEQPSLPSKEQDTKGKSKDELPRPQPQPPPQADEPFDSTILHTTIPFGVALALGSIAFLFLKKKNTTPPRGPFTGLINTPPKSDL
ncbi:erythrocyte membrane protein 1 [Plasmodium falciparum RAJ116]|uniref:Erythrocyte membrane protein 1 n=1 Tax=Plasmodium falciparum RAJ116 TaxID=580058 RepID=A0A0L0CXB8_PLAFA|nr:erythrocyte membrane protein 1 [Plasmodium falciparum RAJ116]